MEYLCFNVFFLKDILPIILIIELVKIVISNMSYKRNYFIEKEGVRKYLEKM